MDPTPTDSTSPSEAALTFQAWLPEQRRRRGETRNQLSQHIPYSPSMIKKIEDGSRLPSREIAERICDYYQASAAERDALLATLRPPRPPAPSQPAPPDPADPAPANPADPGAPALSEEVIAEVTARVLDAGLEQRVLAHLAPQIAGLVMRTVADVLAAENRARAVLNAPPPPPVEQPAPPSASPPAGSIRMRYYRGRGRDSAVARVPPMVGAENQRRREQEQLEWEQYQEQRRRGQRAARTFAVLTGLMGLCLAAAPEPAMVLTLAVFLPLSVALGGWPWVELQVAEGQSRIGAITFLTLAGITGTGLGAFLLLAARAALGW